MSSGDEDVGEDPFKLLMDAITGMKREIKEKFSTSLEELQRKVTANQESSSEEVVSKLKQRAYRFKRKGNEAQFVFNSSVEERIHSAKRELMKLTTPDPRDQTIVRKATLQLDDDLKAIACQQKHIKIADCSELGWQVVAAYEIDELALDSKDEKRLFKAEKEAEIRSKRKRSAATWPRRRASFAGPSTTAPRHGAKGEPSGSATEAARQQSARPRVLGPCYECGQWGHLVESCSVRVPKGTYPFQQPVVSSAVVCSGGHVSKLKCGSVNAESTAMSSMHADGAYEPLGFEMIGESEPIEDDSQGCGMGRFWESQHVSSDVQMSVVQGRLKSHAMFWREVLQAPPTVMDWICNGYKLPLLYMPTPFSQKNHGSALENREFVSGAIMELVRNRCVKKLDSQPFICSPLSVVKNSDGKMRLVLNLRHLNQFLRKDKFKYEDLRVATLMVEKEDFLFKFDLKSSYHHVDIFEDHQKYLGFARELQGRTQYFAFKVLPLGLATACYAFTKLMRPMVKHWRGRGLRVVVYIDDGIAAVKDEAKKESSRVQRDLLDAGWVLNDTKSQWSPEKIITWLGFELDVEQGQLRVPNHKMGHCKSACV